MGNKFMKIFICIVTIMVMLSACSRNDSVQAEQNVQVVENDLGLEEKDIDITTDRQDETTITDTVSEQDEVTNEDGVGEASLYVVETIMTMDQAYAEEKEAIIKIISNFSDIDYENARVLDSCQNEIIEGDVLLLIANNAEKDIKVYGYKSEEYTCRGIVIRYGGINSYFDYSWDDIRGPRGLYVADFDKDGKDEIAICLSGGYGTGYSVERLIIFEESDESRQLVSYELTSEKQQSEIERILDFDIDLANWEFIVNRNGQSERVIDLKKHASRNSNNEFGIDYLNHLHYEVQNDKIVMYINVGIEFDTFKGFTVGFQNNEGQFGFDVIYENGEFMLK